MCAVLNRRREFYCRNPFHCECAQPVCAFTLVYLLLTQCCEVMLKKHVHDFDVIIIQVAHPNLGKVYR